MKRMDSFGDYSNHALQAPTQTPNFQKMNSMTPVGQQFYANAPSFTPQQQMPQMKLNFMPQPAFQR